MTTEFKSSAAVIVLERRGEWAKSLAKRLGEGARQIIECRHRQEVLDFLSQHRASVVAAEGTEGNWESLATFLADLLYRFPSARSIVFADRAIRPFESAFREAGAIEVVYAPLELSRTVRMIERRLAEFADSHPTTQDAILSSLPWSTAAREQP